MNQPSSQQEQKEQESHNTRKEGKVNKKFSVYKLHYFGTYPDPNFRLTDPNPDPDPAIFISDLPEGN
jgi:hypothetical protein